MTFSIKEINTHNINYIAIEDKSENRSYGRRFELIIKDESGQTHRSKELAFKDIYKSVNKLARREMAKGDVETLETIQLFLNELRETENDASQTYANRDDDLYKFRTGCHRLLGFKSHQSNMNHLAYRINHSLFLLNQKNANLILQLERLLAPIYPEEAALDAALDLAKQISGTEKRDLYLRNITRYFNNSRFHGNQEINDHRILKKMLEIAKASNKPILLVELVEIHLRLHNFDSAQKIIDLIPDPNTKKQWQLELQSRMKRI